MRARTFLVLVVMVVLAMALVAAPAGGAPAKNCETLPPDHPKYCGDDPTDPPPSGLVSVSLISDPMWVHEFADVIKYSATFDNNSGAELAVTFDRVEVTVSNELVATLPVGSAKVVAAGASEAWNLAASINVGEVDTLAGGLTYNEKIVGTAIFTSALGVYSAVADSEYLPDPPCGFAFALADGVWTGAAEIDDVCIVAPPEKGIWEVSVAPFPPNNPSKPISVSVTTRDHIPGNWCRLPDGTGGNFGTRWRVGDPPLVGQVYFPGPEGIYGDGVCYDGGRGGTEWFPIGNPDSFYLVTQGFVTFTKPAAATP